MPGPQYTRMTRSEQERALLGLAASTWPWDVKETAMRGVLGFMDLGTATTSTANFTTWTNTLAGYLNVAMPSVPADLGTLDDAALLALLQSMDLAFWDWLRRSNALNNTLQFYRINKEKGGTAPTITEFRDLFLAMANSVRGQRGLANLTA